MKKHNRITYQALLLPLILIFLCTTAFSPLPASVAVAQADITEVVSSGLAYLRTETNDDGGIRWFDDSSSAAATIRVVLALSAVGQEQDALQSDTGNSPIDFLESAGMDWVNQTEAESPGFSVARAGQLLTAIAAANLDPQNFGAQNSNLVFPIVASFDPNTGAYGSATPENVTDQVWAMLGLAANTFSIPPEAAIWLAAAQQDDGSWDDGFGSYLDTTPLAMMALLASGESTDSEEIQSAVDFLVSNQQTDGGWQSEWDTMTNANTTAVILETISALGQLPMDKTWQNLDGNPYSALTAIQQENGAIGGDYANAYSTADALVGLSGQTPFGLGYLKKADLSFDFLMSRQTPDGGWGTVGQTLDIILALQAAGWDPKTVMSADNSPLDFVAEGLSDYIESGPDAVGKAILGVTAAGLDPTNFAGLNLVEALNATFDEETAAFGTAENTWHQAFAILGLHAAGQPVPSSVVDALRALQQEDGGWEYSAGFGSWPDNTALAIQALLAAGEAADSTAVQNGFSYLQSTLVDTGGWGDSSTTAYSLMAVNALGMTNAEWKNDAGFTPLVELFTYQKANGAFVYNWEYTDDNLMSTASALLALFHGDLIVTRSGSDIAYAGLVIDPGKAEATTLCVPIEGELINGMDLLSASGIAYSAPEGFIESIMDISNPDGGTSYWSYWQWNGNAWTFSNSGAGDSVVQAGSIEAWHFTSWETFPSLAPDVIPDLSAICETSVLKNFSEQPSLSYSDLYGFKSLESITYVPVVVDEIEGTAAAPSETSEPTEESLPDESATAEETESAEEHSPLPFYLIGGAAIIVVAVAIFILTKKRK